MTDEERVESIIQIASSFGISCDDASYIIKSFENFGKAYEMSNIEDDIKKLNKFNEYENTVVLSEEALYEIQEAIEHILEEREQDKARIKELEEDLYSANKIINEYLDGIPKQKVKDIAKQIQEEYDKVQEQFDCIWDKKSKDNYDRYKLQELSAMQQELGFILGKFEELLEEGE